MIKVFNRFQALAAVSIATIVTVASAQFAIAQESKTPKDITQAQFEARRIKQFFKADTNGDNLVSRQEFMAAHPNADPVKLGKRFDRIDANHDGSIDKAELTAMLDRRFKRLDKNGDGVLSASERPAKRNQTGGQN